MKLLPCLAKKGCRGQPALAARRPDRPHTAGTLSSPSFRYTCARCGHLSTITSVAFNRLPRLTVDELLALGFTYADLSDPGTLHLVGDVVLSRPR